MAFQGANEMVGARREAGRFLWLIVFGCWQGYFGAEQAAALQHEVLREYWGPNSSTLMAAHSLYSFERHFVLMRSSVVRFDCFLAFAVYQSQAECVHFLAFVMLCLFIHSFAFALSSGSAVTCGMP